MEVPGVRRAAFVLSDGVRLLVVEPADAGPAPDAFAGFSGKGVQSLCFVAKIPTDRRHNAKVEYPALHRILRGVKRWPPA